MKRMPYIIISTTGLLLAVLFFAGCTSMNNKYEEKEVTGVSLSQNHMEYTKCFSFFLRKEDGKCLFDAQVNFYDEPYSIVLESIEVDNKYFDELMALDKQRGISKSVHDNSQKSSLVNPVDATVVTTTVYYADDTDKSAKSRNKNEDLYQFFLGIAMDYKNESVVSMQIE